MYDGYIAAIENYCACAHGSQAHIIRYALIVIAIRRLIQHEVVVTEVTLEHYQLIHEIVHQICLKRVTVD